MASNLQDFDYFDHDQELHQVVQTTVGNMLNLHELSYLFQCAIDYRAAGAGTLEWNFPLTLGVDIPVLTPGLYRVSTIRLIDGNHYQPLHGGPYGSTRSTSSFVRVPGVRGEPFHAGLFTVHGILYQCPLEGGGFLRRQVLRIREPPGAGDALVFAIYLEAEEDLNAL